MQTVGVILVLSLHLPSLNVEGMRPEKFDYIVHMFSFSMPLWMFISGYLMRYTGGFIIGGGNRLVISDLRAYAGKKASRLLLPYFVTGSVVYLIFALLSHFGVAGAERSIGDYFWTMLHPRESLIYPYWFLPTLFFIMVIVRAALNIVRRDWVLVVLMAVSFPIYIIYLQDKSQHDDLYGQVNWLDWIGILGYFVWWGAGYFFCKYHALMQRSLRLDSGWTCLALLAAVVGTHMALPDASWLKAVLGILLTISAGMNYVKHGLRFMNHLNGWSFTIYLLHWFVYVPMLSIHGATQQQWWILLPLTMGFGIYIPILIGKFVQRFLPRARLLKLLVGVR